MRKLSIAGLLIARLAVAGYSGYLQIQTVPSKAGSSDSYSFPLLISGTYPVFATVPNGGRVVNTVTCGVDSIPCPADLIFATDPTCSALLNGWEIVSWSAVTGQISAIVQLPKLSFTAPQSIFACVGNAAVTSWQGGTRGAAWDPNYMVSLHMEESSGTVLYDSTANANNATKRTASNPAPTSGGILGSAQQFAGAVGSSNNDYALFASLTPATPNYTIEYWAIPSSFGNQDVVALESSGGAPNIFTGFYWYPAGTIVYRNSYASSLTPTAVRTTPTGALHNIVFVRSGNTMNVFVDGVAGTQESGFGSGGEQWKGLGWDGGPNGSTNSFRGLLDEVCFSNVARSTDYIVARYNNLSSPSTFYSVSAFTTVVPVPPSTTRADSQVAIY